MSEILGPEGAGRPVDGAGRSRHPRRQHDRTRGLTGRYRRRPELREGHPPPAGGRASGVDRPRPRLTRPVGPDRRVRPDRGAAVAGVGRAHTSRRHLGPAPAVGLGGGCRRRRWCPAVFRLAAWRRTEPGRTGRTRQEAERPGRVPGRRDRGGRRGGRRGPRSCGVAHHLHDLVRSQSVGRLGQ